MILSLIIVPVSAVFFSPTSYEDRENVVVEVGKVTSTRTQIPYEASALPSCFYMNVQMKVEETCRVLCKRDHTRNEMKLFRAMIDNGYRVSLAIDGLPAVDRDERGFAVGYAVEDVDGQDGEEREKRQHLIYNHLRLTVKYNLQHIVGFEVEPFSINHDWDHTAEETALETCDEHSPQSVDRHGEVVYTYDVQWVPSSVIWARRWDVFLPDDEIHFFSIVNSLMIVIFLTGVVGMILVRTLRRDIASDDEEGWKLLSNDVFREPPFAELLSALVGSGAQILGMCFLFKTPLIGYVVTSVLNGYVATKLYCKGLGLVIVPTLFCISILWIDFVLRAQGSSLPFARYVGLAIPLVFLGKRRGLEIRETPPRSIPPQWWLLPTLFGGILPFGAVCIELFFLMSSLWLHQIYYPLIITLVILVATCAQVTIVLTYFQLCNEDYRWHWRSFFSSGSAAFYLFLYSIWYYFAKLDIQGLKPNMLYFASMTIFAFAFFLLCGSIGFLAAFFFVFKIYDAIKLD